MAVLSTSERNNLPDSAFAYIEPGGSKDADNKTTPRSLRHFPIHDAAHVRDALSRMGGSPQGDKAAGKIKAAAHKFGIHVDENSMAQDAEYRELRVTSCYRDLDQPLEYRDLGADGIWIGGYAAVFMPRVSRNLGGFIERVSPECFDEVRSVGWRTKNGDDVICRFNHDPAMILGTVGGDTLHIKTDRVGLDYSVRPPEARADIRELVQRRDIRYSSFAFRCLPGGDEWGITDQNFPLRTLHNVELIDVAPVLSPGYTDATAAVKATSAALRSLANYAQTSVEEIRSLADNEELRKLFTNTGHVGPVHRPAPKTLFGPQAAAMLLARRRDAWDTEGV